LYRLLGDPEKLRLCFLIPKCQPEIFHHSFTTDAKPPDHAHAQDVRDLIACPEGNETEKKREKPESGVFGEEAGFFE
jgi:hypothetical protein